MKTVGNMSEHMAQMNNKHMLRFQFFIYLFLFFVVVVLWGMVSR